MASTWHNTSCTEVEINLKEFLQEQILHSKRETWAILRSFGFSILLTSVSRCQRNSGRNLFGKEKLGRWYKHCYHRKK